MARPLLERSPSWPSSSEDRWRPARHLTHDPRWRRKVEWYLSLQRQGHGVWALESWTQRHPYADRENVVTTFYPNERAGKEALRRAIIVRLLTAG